MIIKKWWKYAVLRGDNMPAELEGMWYDLEDMPINSLSMSLNSRFGIELIPTNQWEQREDGEVAVVYKWYQK